MTLESQNKTKQNKANKTKHKTKQKNKNKQKTQILQIFAKLISNFHKKS